MFIKNLSLKFSRPITKGRTIEPVFGYVSLLINEDVKNFKQINVRTKLPVKKLPRKLGKDLKQTSDFHKKFRMVTQYQDILLIDPVIVENMYCGRGNLRISSSMAVPMIRLFLVHKRFDLAAKFMLDSLEDPRSGDQGMFKSASINFVELEAVVARVYGSLLAWYQGSGCPDNVRLVWMLFYQSLFEQLRSRDHREHGMMSQLLNIGELQLTTNELENNYYLKSSAELGRSQAGVYYQLIQVYLSKTVAVDGASVAQEATGKVLKSKNFVDLFLYDVHDYNMLAGKSERSGAAVLLFNKVIILKTLTDFQLHDLVLEIFQLFLKRLNSLDQVAQPGGRPAVIHEYHGGLFLYLVQDNFEFGVKLSRQFGLIDKKIKKLVEKKLCADRLDSLTAWRRLVQMNSYDKVALINLVQDFDQLAKLISGYIRKKTLIAGPHVSRAEPSVEEYFGLMDQLIVKYDEVNMNYDVNRMNLFLNYSRIVINSFIADHDDRDCLDRMADKVSVLSMKNRFVHHLVLSSESRAGQIIMMRSLKEIMRRGGRRDLLLRWFKLTNGKRLSSEYLSVMYYFGYFNQAVGFENWDSKSKAMKYIGKCDFGQEDLQRIYDLVVGDSDALRVLAKEAVQRNLAVDKLSDPLFRRQVSRQLVLQGKMVYRNGEFHAGNVCYGDDLELAGYCVQYLASKDLGASEEFLTRYCQDHCQEIVRVKLYQSIIYGMTRDFRSIDSKRLRLTKTFMRRLSERYKYKMNLQVVRLVMRNYLKYVELRQRGSFSLFRFFSRQLRIASRNPGEYQTVFNELMKELVTMKKNSRGLWSIDNLRKYERSGS